MPEPAKRKVRLIALDLDGTLLNTNKELSQRNRQALCQAARRGIEIVPTTGRLPGALPETVRELPFLHYVIAVNGALVADLERDAVLYRAEIPWARALQVMTRLEELPVIYDCYMEGKGYMSQSQYAQADGFTSDPHVLQMIRTLRKPVPDLRGFVRGRQTPIQKMQMFFHTAREKNAAAPGLVEAFSDLALASSYENNIEINSIDAQKGKALRALCAHLGIDIAQTVAFGDGGNDLSLIEAAGLGVAMANAEDAVKAAADAVTASCDEDGVAVMLERLEAEAQSE